MTESALFDQHIVNKMYLFFHIPGIKIFRSDFHLFCIE